MEYLDDLYAHHGGPPAAPVERGRAIHDMFRTRETELLGRLLGFLAGRDDVRVVGPADPARRAPTVSVVPLRLPVAAAAESLIGAGMMVGHGDFYAPRLLEGMGIAPEQGVLRMSFIHYTTAGEIDRLIEALDRALAL